LISGYEVFSTKLYAHENVGRENLQLLHFLGPFEKVFADPCYRSLQCSSIKRFSKKFYESINISEENLFTRDWLDRNVFIQTVQGSINHGHWTMQISGSAQLISCGQIR